MWAFSFHTSWASALTSSVRILSRVKVCSTATNLGHMQEHLRACGESGHFTWFTYVPTPLIALCFPWKHVAHALPWTKAARWLYVGAPSATTDFTNCCVRSKIEKRADVQHPTSTTVSDPDGEHPPHGCPFLFGIYIRICFANFFSLITTSFKTKFVMTDCASESHWQLGCTLLAEATA